MIVDKVIKGEESHPRSVAKAVSWRILGSIDTFVLGFFFTGGDAKVAGAIASTEVVTKIVLYYFHERLWSVTHWGIRRRKQAAALANDEPMLEKTPESKL